MQGNGKSLAVRSSRLVARDDGISWWTSTEATVSTSAAAEH